MNDPQSAAHSTTPETDLSGKVIGDYHLLRRLGQGGMAEVYLAEQRSLKRRIAIKVLRRNLAEDENYVRRFHNEAQAAAALVHANIVQIHEVGCIDGVHFIAQEYVEGQNLKQVIARNRTLSINQTVTILRQVAAALHKAGSFGIVHRDIKPENILIGLHGETKVADFGLARISRDQPLDLTQIGVTMGTPLYMSPEQVEGHRLDHRSDIYSLGVTCYHMVSGSPPFEGDNALNVAVQHVRKEPERLENIRPDLPSDLCRIIHRMLAKKPDDRYADASQLLRDLRQIPIAGNEEDFASEMHDMVATEQLTLSTSGMEATQQLQTLMMQADGHRTASKRTIVALAICLTMSFGLGTAFSLSRETDPLSVNIGSSSSSVEKKTTLREQWTYAALEKTPEAWESVWKYHSEESQSNAVYANSARANLAILYLRDERYDRAMELFDYLAGQDPTQRKARLAGLAGQAIVYDQQGDNSRLSDNLTELEKNRDAWDELPPFLRDGVDRILKRMAPEDADNTS